LFPDLELHRIAWEEASKLQEGGEDESGEETSNGVHLAEMRRHSAQQGRGLHGQFPKPQITAFKVVFLCWFLLALMATFAARGYAQDPTDKSGAQASSASDAGSGLSSTLLRGWVLLKASVTVLLWMIISVIFIIFNKYMFTLGGFPYPVTLTAMHMASCYVVLGLVALLPRRWGRELMPDAERHITLGLYAKGLVPAALFMAVGLGVGNLGFLFATVAFIQMVKPVNVVITSLAGFAWGLEVVTPTHVCIALIVSGGVAMAAAGEVQFSLAGLICQLVASTSEGLRLILLQGIMQGSLKLDPLTTLYRFTPVAGMVLCLLSCFLEGPVDWSGLKMPAVLLLNCLLAVCLNVLIAAVVHQTSAVVFVLAGVTKDIATIAISAAMYRSPVTHQEVVGYAISLVGICMYKVYKDNVATFKELGMIHGFIRVCSLAKTTPGPT